MYQDFLSPNELVMIQQAQNIRSGSWWFLTASLPLSITKWWETRLQTTAMRNSYKADDWHGIAYDLHNFNLQVALSNYFTISKQPQIKLTLTGYYSTPTLSSIYMSAPYWYVSAGAQCTFAKGRAVIAISCYDIFQVNKDVLHSVLAGQSQYYESGFYSRSFSASLTWKFGNFTGTRVRNSEMDASRAQ
jgi:hypothetical protein